MYLQKMGTSSPTERENEEASGREDMFHSVDRLQKSMDEAVDARNSMFPSDLRAEDMINGSGVVHLLNHKSTPVSKASENGIAI